MRRGAGEGCASSVVQFSSVPPERDVGAAAATGSSIFYSDEELQTLDGSRGSYVPTGDGNAEALSDPSWAPPEVDGDAVLSEREVHADGDEFEGAFLSAENFLDKSGVASSDDGGVGGDIETLPDITGYLDQVMPQKGPPTGNDRPLWQMEAEELRMKLTEVAVEVYALNDGVEFNIASPKQVAAVLFGPEGGSTARDVLDAMASSGNSVASAVLRWRKLSQALKKIDARKQANVEIIRRDDMAAAAGKPAPSPPDDPLLLIDASHLLYRSYHSMPPLHRGDGQPTGAILGVCNGINRLLLDGVLRFLSGLSPAPRAVMVLDTPGPTHRHEMYEDYKAHRPPAPVDLVAQFPFVAALSKAYGLPCFGAKGYEADDVIATLARRASDLGVDVRVVSTDKDLMQLVTPPDWEGGSIALVDPVKMTETDHLAVEERWGVPAESLGDLLALAGDSADNIPGVPGIGPKIAAQLLNEYGNLETLLENAASIKQKARREKLLDNTEMARLSRRLVELECDVPLSLMGLGDADDVTELRMGLFDPEELLRFAKGMGLRDLARRLSAKFGEAGVGGFEGKKSMGKRAGQWKGRAVVAVPTTDDFKDVPF